MSQFPDLDEGGGCPCCRARLEEFRNRVAAAATDLELDEFVVVSRRVANCLIFGASADDDDQPLAALCEPLGQLASLAMSEPRGRA